MKQYEIEEVLQHLERAQYIGASKAISLIHKLNQRRQALQQRVADLEEVIDANNLSQNIGQFVNFANEPVAWTDGRGNYFDKNSFFPVDDLIPLYTHPAKTLTDEGIVKEWAKFYPDVFHTHLIDFARAILKKASEK
jgi:hypothetical protein